MNRLHWAWIGLLVLSSTLSAQDNNGAVYRTYTIKNESNQTANDLHFKLKKVFNDTGALPKITKARSQAFSDPPSLTPAGAPDTADWPDPDDPAGSVPPGGEDKFAICTDKNHSYEEAYFTHDGTEISSRVTRFGPGWKIDQGQVYAVPRNPTEQGAIVITSLLVYTGNDLANFQANDTSFPYETPSGTLAFSGSNILLNPGEELPIPLGAPIPHSYYLIRATVAPAANLADTFFVASGWIPVVSVPALPKGFALSLVGCAILGLAWMLRARTASA